MSDNSILDNYIQYDEVDSTNIVDVIRSKYGDIKNRIKWQFNTSQNLAVRVVSNSVAELMVSSRIVDKDGKRVDDYDNILNLVTRTPNPESGATPIYQWWQSVVAEYCLEGNAILFIDRASDEDATPVALRFMDAGRVTTAGGIATVRYPERTAESRELWYSAASEAWGRVKATLHGRGEEDVCHFKWPHPPSVSGSNNYMAPSNRKILAKEIDVSEYATSFMTRVVERHPFLLNALIHEGATQDMGVNEDLLDLMSNYTKRVVSAPFLLQGKYRLDKMIGIEIAKDIVELRNHFNRMLAGYYGIPPMLLGLESSAFGSGIEAIIRAIYRFGYKPHVIHMLDVLSMRLLGHLPGGLRFAPDESAILRGDYQALSTILPLILSDGQRPSLVKDEYLMQWFGFPMEALPDEGDKFKPVREVQQKDPQQTESTTNVTDVDNRDVRDIIERAVSDR